MGWVEGYYCGGSEAPMWGRLAGRQPAGRAQRAPPIGPRAAQRAPRTIAAQDTILPHAESARFFMSFGRPAQFSARHLPLGGQRLSIRSGGMTWRSTSSLNAARLYR